MPTRRPSYRTPARHSGKSLPPHLLERYRTEGIKRPDTTYPTTPATTPEEGK